MTSTLSRRPSQGVVGETAERPDGMPKAKGEYAYASDLWAEGMLWGATLRSPYPRARITDIDVRKASGLSGVRAVLTHSDVPGRKTFGLGRPDQPVLASNEVRYQGEPVAVVAADDPEVARCAVGLIHVSYEPLDLLTDPESALKADAPVLHDGNVIHHLHIERGDPDVEAPVVVSGSYEVGMQDQAALGTEAALAIPLDDGTLEVYVASQWIHEDLSQLSASLALPPERIRVVLAGVGGAFGAREDISVQIHCALLALASMCPVKMVYSREESFYGHVHRHPARMYYKHGADEEGTLIFVRARIILDGGAYTSTSMDVTVNAGAFSTGPYDVPNLSIDCTSAYTNNPPCGAMRGFGSVQVCFAYESQMNKLADALGMDPVELRIKNALRTGSLISTGQPLRGPIGVDELLRTIASMPQPQPGLSEPWQLPGGLANVTRGEGINRGIGYAIGFKGFCFSQGADDYSTARVQVSLVEGEPFARIQTAAAEIGQGLNTVQTQIVRTELGLEHVSILPVDTSIGSSGSSSASRQTYMTGGAVRLACEAVREEAHRRGASPSGPIEWGRVLAAGSIDQIAEFHHPATHPLDPETGQGNTFVSFAFAAHRAVVDVDTELGQVRVVELATAQDVGKSVNPQAIEGQIEGGTAQGLGLATMEELQVRDGILRNPSFTDYLIPTTMDMPPVRSTILEFPDPDAPYGVKGAGEPPAISSGPAIVAAIENAIGKKLNRMPVRPDDIVFDSEPDAPELDGS